MPQSGWLVHELEVRGVVEFSETFDVFAVSSGWVDDVFISRGDYIDANTIIARYSPLSSVTPEAIATLGFNLERTEHQLEVMHRNRAIIQSNLRALSAESPDDLLPLQWAIADAEANIERLYAANAHAGYGADRDRNILLTELRDAELALQVLRTENEDNNFDDFLYQQSIIEATVTLERRTADFENAEAALAEAMSVRAASFDNFHYQNAINAARTAHERSVTAYNEANTRLHQAQNQFHMLLLAGADFAEITAAQNAVNEAESGVTAARQVRNDNNTALEQATSAMRRAQNAFNAQAQEALDQNIADAELRLTQAQNNLDDATRAYENAVAMLDRARDSATSTAITDAERRLENALNALEESEWGELQNLPQAEATIADAYHALERAIANLELAERALTSQMDDTRRTLELELQAIDLEITRINIDLRANQLSYEMSANAGSAVDVISRHRGRVINVDKREGQFVSQGERIATVGVDNGIFIVEFSIPMSDAGFIDVGDNATLYMGGSNIGISAAVYSITPQGESLTMTLRAETDRLSGGEYVRIRFNKQSELHHMLVPNSAIFAGDMGQRYIWTLQGRQGVLGMEYRSVRVSVRVLDFDEMNTAIQIGFMASNTPVITSYSRELSINGRVGRME